MAAFRPDGSLSGVTTDLARDLGDVLGVPVELLPYTSGGNVVRALTADRWDIAFLAAEPERAEAITFTAPYLFIEGTYLVHDGSTAESVDEPLSKPASREPFPHHSHIGSTRYSNGC